MCVVVYILMFFYWVVSCVGNNDVCGCCSVECVGWFCNASVLFMCFRGFFIFVFHPFSAIFCFPVFFIFLIFIIFFFMG